MVGVGEVVKLTYSDGSGDSATWSAPSGTFDSSSGMSVNWTAPDRAPSGGGVVTITAKGPKCTAKIKFTVIEPSSLTAKASTPTWHTYNSAAIGFGLIYWVGPDTVNFSNIQVQELSVSAPSSATGVYDGYTSTPLAAGAIVGMNNTVVSGLGTPINFAAAPHYDTVWSSVPIKIAPYVPGVLIYNVPVQYRVGTGAWKTFKTVSEFFLLKPDATTLEVSKAGASGTCQVSDPNVYPPTPPPPP